MTHPREEEVYDSEQRNVPHLRHHDTRSEKPRWVLDGEEGEEMHPFVLGFLQQGVDPPLIVFQATQTAQMPVHASHEAWHPSHRLQEQHPIEPLSLGHQARLPGKDLAVPAHHVKTDAHAQYEKLSESVSESLRSLVLETYCLDLLASPLRMRQGVVHSILLLRLSTKI
jgi:hypothetical protein